MPTVIKSTSKIAELGELSTYNASSSATPYDTADTSGSVPTFSATLANGDSPEFQIGETLTLTGAAIGELSGEIVAVSKSANSARHTLSANTFLDRLNTEQRIYPGPVYSVESTTGPIAALDYWSQQCGIFYDNVAGDALYYQSIFGHAFAFAKGTARPVKGSIQIQAGGESVTYQVVDGRRGLNFGKNTTLTTTMPKDFSLPVLIPNTPDTDKMVFSSGVYNTGVSRSASITWNLLTPVKNKIGLRVLIDSSNGVTLQRSEDGVTYTDVSNVPTATGGNYRFYVGVSTPTSTTTTFDLKVLDTAGVNVGVTSVTVGSVIRGSLSMASTVHAGLNVGSGAPIVHWGNFVSLMTALPTARPTQLKNFTAGPKSTMIFPGFSGNVWEHMKAYCSVYHLDISCPDGKLTVGPRQTEVTSSPSLSQLNLNISARDKARFVEVVNQQSKPTMVGGVNTAMVMWSADSVYQVGVGETQTFKVQTDHSILSLKQPVAVSGINPFPYLTGTGQYVVTGSDGYIVSPSFWNSQGGLITVDTTDVDGEIEVTIKGPDFESVRAPYRISEGDAGRPALHVTGEGLINDPVTIKVSTGNTKAAKEVGVTIDSPFITDLTLAYDAAARASRTFATPEFTASVSEPLGYDEPSTLGTSPAGKLVKRNGNVVRVTSVNQMHSSVNGTVEQHNTIHQISKSFGTGATIGEQNAYYDGKTIGQVNLRPLKELQ